MNTQSRLPGLAELRGGHKITHCRGPAGAPGPLRLRKHNSVICQVQTPSKTKGSGVVMRKLPLPGSETAETRSTPAETYVSESQQSSSGQTYSTGQTYYPSTTAQQDAARRNSNRETSTSSSASSVIFEPYQRSAIVRGNGSFMDNSHRKQEAKVYDVTTSINQAAPGFTAASIAASASKDQRAESLIAEAEGQSKFT